MNRKEFAKKWGESYEPNIDKFVDCSTRLLSDLTEMLEQESKGKLLPKHDVILSDKQKKEEYNKGFEDVAKAAADDILSSI